MSRLWRGVGTRDSGDKTLTYIEGWHAIAEANRIFGFDGWDRTTTASTCVWQGQVNGQFACSYAVRVRISVRAGEAQVTREGSGCASATGSTAAEAYEFALKAAETDATKRALATFGNQFGLSLYDSSLYSQSREKGPNDKPSPSKTEEASRIARPDHSSSETKLEPRSTSPPQQETGRIDKSELAILEPQRMRDKRHLRFVGKRPCLVCGRIPAYAHHITFAQPKALGRKVSNEFTVPLCALHHRSLHTSNDERSWRLNFHIDPVSVALRLMAESRNVERLSLAERVEPR